MVRENPDGTKTPLTMPNHSTLKSLPFALFAYGEARKTLMSAPIHIIRCHPPTRLSSGPQPPAAAGTEVRSRIERKTVTGE